MSALERCAFGLRLWGMRLRLWTLRVELATSWIGRPLLLVPRRRSG
ncbi:MAG: hypothetical protein QM778_06930 [Myxococcales bacterium]